jgi:hypothetical protein
MDHPVLVWAKVSGGGCREHHECREQGSSGERDYERENEVGLHI